MAEKRMFARTIIRNDLFMDLPTSAKALYFLLGMEADDEWFVSPKMVMRIYWWSDDDLKILIMKNFVIQFESGVVVITDRKENNYLDKNRIKQTQYKLEKSMLKCDANKYQFTSQVKQPLNKCLTSIEENRIEESRIEEKREEIFWKFVKLSQEEFEKLKQRFSERVVLDLIEKIENWIVNKKKWKSPYIDYYMAIINRAKKDNKDLKQLTEQEIWILRENRNTPQGIEAVNKYKPQLSKYTDKELNELRLNALFNYVNNA